MEIHLQSSSPQVLLAKGVKPGIPTAGFFCSAVGSGTIPGFSPKKGGVIMGEFKTANGVLFKKIFAKRIRRNGKYVYPKRAKAFCFWVKVR